MTPSHDTPQRQRYLVHAGCGKPLNDFLALARTDADITVLELVGPRDAPHTAVLELDDATAQRLQRQFRASGAAPIDQLTIEPDRPLSLFDNDPAGPP